VRGWDDLLGQAPRRTGITYGLVVGFGTLIGRGLVLREAGLPSVPLRVLVVFTNPVSAEVPCRTCAQLACIRLFGDGNVGQ
jgi:hypothetical protein